MGKEKPVPGGKKSRKEPGALNALDFTPVKIDISDPVSLILLLNSKEIPVLVQVMSALAHYANKSEECASKLVDNDILAILFKLLGHSDVCCQRYAFRILSHLVFNQTARNTIVREKEHFFPQFLTCLSNPTDVILQEYSSKIFSSLTKDPVGCAYLTDSCTLERLVTCLTSPDPDVQKNVLEVIIDYLNDPDAKPAKEFNFQPLLDLLVSEYPVIQNLTLDILCILTERLRDVNLKKLLKSSGGVEKLMALLEKFEWKDLHSKLLVVIGNLADSQDDFDSLSPDDVKRLLSYVIKAMDVINLEQAWETISKLANKETCRKVLKDNQILEKMLPLLKAQSENLCASICVALTRFMLDSDTMEDIATMNPIPSLVSLLRNSSHWKTKECAIVAIREALKRSSVMTKELIDNKKYLQIQQFFTQPVNEIPSEVMKVAFQCMTLLAQSESFRKDLAPSVLPEVVNVIKETTEDSVRVSGLNFLNQLAYDESFSTQLADKYVEHIWDTVLKHSSSLPTSVAVAQFIEIASKNNPAIAVAFIKTGALHWMLKNKDSQQTPVWRSAINVIFSKHLSAKFAYKGRLDYNDIIKDQFYVRKEGISLIEQLNEKFPVYDEILEMDQNESMKPIYLVNILYEDNISNTSSEKNSVTGSIKSGHGKTSTTSIKSGKPPKTSINSSHKSITIISDEEEVKSLRIKKDENLMLYIQKIKELLEAEKQSHIITIDDKPVALPDSDVEARAQVIAKFVCNQLSGPDPKIPCSSHYVDLHIEQLKEELSTNLILIGLLRAGLAMERALLFKVLADQVGFPCALVRGQCGQAWIEITLPILPPPPAPCLPTSLLKPSHIVDLLHNPGDLLPINSYSAKKYTSIPYLRAYNL